MAHFLECSCKRVRGNYHEPSYSSIVIISPANLFTRRFTSGCITILKDLLVKTSGIKPNQVTSLFASMWPSDVKTLMITVVEASKN